nr:hypothetical protein [Burkholderia oklahomensis]
MRADSATGAAIGARAAGCSGVAARLRGATAACRDGVNVIGRLRAADTAACVAGRRSTKRSSGVAGRGPDRLPIAATAAVEPIGLAMPAAAGANGACGAPDGTGVPSGVAAPPADAATPAGFASPPAGIVPAALARPVAGAAETGCGAFAAVLPCVAGLAAFGTPLAGIVAVVGLAALGVLLTGMAAPAVFAGSPVVIALPAAFENPVAGAAAPAAAAFATPLAAASVIAAADAAPRAGAPGLSHPEDAVGSTAARAAPPAAALRRSPRGASFGFHSVGREKRPFCRGAIELTVCAVVGCTSAARRTRRSSSRCSAARGRSATPRDSSSPRSRAKRIPNDASSHAFTCCQRTPTSHGSPTKNSTTIASGVPMCPNTRSKPPASAWPSAFVVASPGSAVASVQLATSTQKKPSHSRIEPWPARPPPPGSIALTSRQKRGMNQTAEKPNQPRTTVCMLRNWRRTGRDARPRRV